MQHSMNNTARIVQEQDNELFLSTVFNSYESLKNQEIQNFVKGSHESPSSNVIDQKENNSTKSNSVENGEIKNERPNPFEAKVDLRNPQANGRPQKIQVQVQPPPKPQDAKEDLQ